MSDLGSRQREANRARQALSIHSSEMQYRNVYATRDIQWHKSNQVTLEASARAYVQIAFDLLVGEVEDLAREVLGRAIEFAEEALRTEDFEKLYFPYVLTAQRPVMRGEPIPEKVVRPSPKQLEIEKLHGRMTTLEALHYAVWFKDGQRPMDILRESYELRKRCYRGRGGNYAFEELVFTGVQAEDYESAIPWCKRKVPRAVLPPDTGHFKRNKYNALYVLCEYAAGNRSLEAYARDGVEYWFQRCRDWVHEDVNLPWWIRLAWAYLRGRHFVRVTDARAVIREVRGF